jgi:protein FrlC
VEEGQKRAAEMLWRLSEEGRKCGITLVAESLRPQETRIGSTVYQMKKIFDMVDHPNFKVMIDLTAMSVAGETIQDWFDVFGSKNIAHAHFQDCNPMGHYIWGGGNRNLRKDLEVMVKNGYEGYFTQELTIADYYLNPFRYDKLNLQNLRMYMQ